MKSAVETDKTIQWKDGQEYPLYAVETSMYSHPLYTGTQRIIDVEGRVEKFNKKYRKSEPVEENAIRTTREEMS
jgi:large subunit ribosomal protein L31